MEKPQRSLPPPPSCLDLEEDQEAEEGHDDELVEVVLEGEVPVLAAALLLGLLQAQLVLLAAAAVPSSVSEEVPLCGMGCNISGTFIKDVRKVFGSMVHLPLFVFRIDNQHGIHATSLTMPYPSVWK